MKNFLRMHLLVSYVLGIRRLDKSTSNCYVGVIGLVVSR
jgi:hypothetical protein